MKNSKPSFDQFYTKPEIAEHCVKQLQKYSPFENYKYIIEPSAGTGSIYSLLPEDKRIGLDIEPKFPSIKLADFFQWIPPTDSTKENTLIVGNPPFGAQSKLARQFFQKSSFIANTIAFIIPITWNNWSIQKQLPREYALIHSEPLPFKSFFTEDHGEYGVRCLFQVWTSSDKIHEQNLRILTAPITTTPDFEFLTRGHTPDFYFVVCGSRQKLVLDPPISLSQATVERISIRNPSAPVREFFESTDWSKYYKGNTGTMWINRESIIKEYEIFKNN